MATVAYQATVSALRDGRKALARTFAEELAVEYGVTVGDILGRCRVPAVALARHELMTRLWQFGLTLKDVGRTLDRDHTSVLHGVRRILGDRYAKLSPGPGRTR